MPIITIRKLITYFNNMLKNYSNHKNIVLLANGEFPTHDIPLKILKKVNYIVCCDGSADSLIQSGKSPNIIIGDLDSINPEIKSSYLKNIISIKDQNDNDFRKALDWISTNIKLKKLYILGSTGLREDHAIGNLTTFLYNKFEFEIEILTDTGIFHTINSNKSIKAFKGQCISIFSINPNQKIYTTGLKYELTNNTLKTLYSGTLNLATQNNITIQTELGNPILLYAAY